MDTQSSIRTLKMSQRLTDDLKTMKNELKKDKNFNENYFVNGDMFPVATNTITNHKNQNCRLDNVKQIRIHDFRHYCASLLINRGGNVQIVAKYLRHTKIEEALKTHAHLFLSLLDEIVKVIDRLDK